LISFIRIPRSNFRHLPTSPQSKPIHFDASTPTSPPDINLQTPTHQQLATSHPHGPISKSKIPERQPPILMLTHHINLRNAHSPNTSGNHIARFRSLFEDDHLAEPRSPIHLKFIIRHSKFALPLCSIQNHHHTAK
jgi:hypothetical protein